MSDELAKTDDAKGELVSLEDLAENTAVSKYGDEAFENLRSSTYLPRLQLMTANAGECKKARFPVNHYAIVEGSNFKDVGKTVDCLILAWRPKALEIDDEILTIYDPDDAEFARIQDRADNEKDSNCMWGFEFLMWLGTQKRFVTFFCGTKSARREAPNIKSLVNKAATLRSKLIETKKFTWQGIDVVACSTPMGGMPQKVKMTEEIEKFNNPPKSAVEKAPEEGRAV